MREFQHKSYAQHHIFYADSVCSVCEVSHVCFLSSRPNPLAPWEANFRFFKVVFLKILEGGKLEF
jgi:hypothetical protein